MRGALAILAGLAAIGCGDNIEIRDPDRAISGSRLRVMHRVYDDGTSQLETEWLHDRARGEDCAPMVWSDGARYCTPASEPAVFVDGGCTMLVGKAPRGAPPAYFRRVYVVRGEPRPSRLYEPREPVAAPALVWELFDGLCIGPIDADPDADYIALGPEIASSALVRVAKLEQPADTRLAHSLYASDDGMQLPITRALRDTVLDVECAPRAVEGDPHATCVPAMPIADYFRDDACTEPALAIRSGDETPAYVEHAGGDGCPSYAHVGDAIDLPSPFRRTAAGCTAAIASSDDRFFAIGAPLDLVRLPRAPSTDGARLARIELRDGDHVFEDARLADTMLDIECERVPTPEGDRCLPAASITAEREPTFRDDACTDPLALVLVPATSCRVPTHVVDAAGPRALVPYAGAIFHLSTGDRCLPYSLAGTARSYELGPVLPLSTFAAATTVIE